jgi:hypothetical protein
MNRQAYGFLPASQHRLLRENMICVSGLTCGVCQAISNRSGLPLCVGMRRRRRSLLTRSFVCWLSGELSESCPVACIFASSNPRPSYPCRSLVHFRHRLYTFMKGSLMLLFRNTTRSASSTQSSSVSSITFLLRDNSGISNPATLGEDCRCRKQ